jgi:hypothetical protein
MLIPFFGDNAMWKWAALPAYDRSLLPSLQYLSDKGKGVVWFRQSDGITVNNWEGERR